ncbi:MgtC/SapB family protein [Microcoleus sp. FACHB-1515]|uniref:MgtC/SapB family protein n=1 Tax=Cyanophyceae TaxID=3028117 RepID=UPI001683B258|nr:MgtC/SapB family protein [Microcoleus sp. FACHB-1515]MBD2092746.1 MgtC/SapB family protein [Microcoleus sp. FACHB-1515]
MSEISLPIDWQHVLLRLVLAIVVGGLIGLERQLDRKPAGLRTHMLVSLGAAIFVLSGLSGSAIDSGDHTRVIQGITTGVGFLGAGEIISRTDRRKVQVRGLTSAAAIWVSAALGVAIGAGLWFIGVTGGLLTLFVLWGVKQIEERSKLDNDTDS